MKQAVKEILVMGLKSKGFKKTFEERNPRGEGGNVFEVYEDKTHINFFFSYEEEDAHGTVSHYYCQKGDHTCIKRLLESEDLIDSQIFGRDPFWREVVKQIKSYGGSARVMKVSDSLKKIRVQIGSILKLLPKTKHFSKKWEFREQIEALQEAVKNVDVDLLN